MFRCKNCGGGGEADDLGNYNVYEYRFLRSCHFNSDLYSISRAEALRSPFAPRFVYVIKIPT